ncbi:predicted protein [Fibroporia radiculosa]|uniref:Uncharacterized protein n=1 Tax=Fibroporia radiculosa TaxID=599839 RepID=J7RI38_9APHY|nr:predicted protein [Fibroporia radiculosa]
MWTFSGQCHETVSDRLNTPTSLRSGGR